MSRYDMARDRPDDFQTMPWALDVLVPYLNRKWILWECACGTGKLVGGLGERGFCHIIATDLHTLQIERDFLTWQPERFDMILTNPPFSLKDEFLTRCYELGKPFALLLPLTALEGQVRQRLYAKHGLELVFLPRRPEFETPVQKKVGGSWFAAAWFTNGLNIGRQLNFNPPYGGGSAFSRGKGANPFIARMNDRSQQKLVMNGGDDGV